MAENIEKLILDDSGFINPLKESIKVMEDTERAFKDMQNSAKNTGKTIGTDLVQANEKAAKTFAATTKAVFDQVRSQEEHKRKVGEVTGAILTNGQAAAKLQEIFKKLNDAKLSGVVSDLSKIEEELVDVLEKVKLTDDQFQFLAENIEDVVKEIGKIDATELANLANQSEKTTTEFVNLKKELKDLKLQINSGQLTGEELVTATKRAAELTDQLGDTNEKLKALASDTKGIDTLVEGARAVAAGFSIAEGAAALFGEENEEVQRALVKLNAIMAISNGLQEAHVLLMQNGALATSLASAKQVIYTTVVGTSTGAMKLFRIALAGTGVGLLVIALGALIANFDDVKKKVNEVLPGLEKFGSFVSGVWTSIKSVLGGIGDIAGNLFKGDFSAAYEDAKKIGSNAKAAFNEGFEKNEQEKADKIIGDSLDKLSKQQKRRAEIIAARGGDNFKLLQSSLQNEITAMVKHGKDVEEIDEKRHELELMNAEREEEIKQRRIKTRQELLDKFKEASDKIFEISRDAGLLSEREIFQAVKEQTIKSYKELLKTLKESSAALGIDTQKGQENLQILIKQAEERQFAVNEVKKLPAIIKGVTSQIEPIPITIDGPKIDKPLLDDIENEINTFEDLFATVFQGIFKDGEEGAKEFLLGANTLINEFANISNEATNIQLNNIDKQLDKLSERREKLQDDLSRELELQEKGLANNVGNKQAEVDSLLAEEERLQAERERIQKEAQKRQLISDTIAQSQSLITSSINIIKGFSNIPIVGLPLGIAAVGALLAFFAKTKVEAFKATKLYTGAEKISDHFGYGERHGDTDLPGRGSGYRLINERTGKPTNVIISGKEMLLPESVSLPNTEFFHSLRNGVYNGIDLNAAMGFYLNYKGKVAKATQNTVVVSHNVPQVKNKARVAIPHTMKNGRKGVIITTIKEDWTDGKFIEFDL